MRLSLEYKNAPAEAKSKYMLFYDPSDDVEKAADLPKVITDHYKVIDDGGKAYDRQEAAFVKADKKEEAALLKQVNKARK